jgi:hypothetical protein
MQIQNIVIKLEKPEKLTVDYIENEIKKHGDPLRWAIVKEEHGNLFINSVVIF